MGNMALVFGANISWGSRSCSNASSADKRNVQVDNVGSFHIFRELGVIREGLETIAQASKISGS